MNATDSKKYITEALFSLMEEKDYKEITITDIAKKAGLSRMTFYRHFDNKTDIIKYYLTEITDDFLDSKHPNYLSDDKKEYIIALFYHLKRYLRYGKLLFDAGLSYLLKDEFDRAFKRNAKTREELFSAYMASGAYYALYCAWLENGQKETPEELAEYKLDF